jgi:hypothetical protein
VEKHKHYTSRGGVISGQIVANAAVQAEDPGKIGVIKDIKAP